MTRTRRWAAGTAVVALLVVVAAWFLLITPKHSEAAELRAATLAQEGTNDQLRARLEELKAKSADLPALEARLAAVQTKLPEGAELPSLVRALTAEATAAGLDLQGITPSTPELVSGPLGDVTLPAEPATSEGAQDTPAPPEASPASGEQLYAVPLTVNLAGRYSNVSTFVNGLEELSRSFLVTGFTLSENTVEGEAKGGTLLSLTGRVFVLTSTAPEVVALPAPVDPATAKSPEGPPVEATGETQTPDVVPPDTADVDTN